MGISESLVMRGLGKGGIALVSDVFRFERKVKVKQKVGRAEKAACRSYKKRCSFRAAASSSSPSVEFPKPIDRA